MRPGVRRRRQKYLEGALAVVAAEAGLVVDAVVGGELVDEVHRLVAGGALGGRPLEGGRHCCRLSPSSDPPLQHNTLQHTLSLYSSRGGKGCWWWLAGYMGTSWCWGWWLAGCGQVLTPLGWAGRTQRWGMLGGGSVARGLADQLLSWGWRSRAGEGETCVCTRTRWGAAAGSSGMNGGNGGGGGGGGCGKFCGVAKQDLAGREGGRETDGDKRGAGKQFQTIIRERERDDSEF